MTSLNDCLTRRSHKPCRMLNSWTVTSPTNTSHMLTHTGDTHGAGSLFHHTAAQLSAFVANTSHALCSVKSLALILPPATGSSEQVAAIEDANAAVLSPLAAACPQLQQLTVTGPIAATFLQQLGASCKKLTHVWANLTHLSSPTLQSMCKLLPHLTSLTALSPPQIFSRFTAHRWPSNSSEHVDAICTVLNACPSLASFDTGSIKITRDIWRSLPTGLQTLACSVSSHLLDDDWVQHANLCKLYFSRTVFKVGITQLGLLLAASPSVVSVCLAQGSMKQLCVAYSQADARYLQLLDKRLGLGLTLHVGSSRVVDRVGQCSMQLSFDIDYTCRVTSDPSSDHSLLLLPAFMDILVQGSLSKFTSLSFESDCMESCDGRDGNTTGGLSHLARVFPNVTHLCVGFMSLNTADMQAISDCALLQSLVLQTVGGLSTAELRLLVLRSKSLQSLDLWDCAGVTAQDRWTIRGNRGGRSVNNLCVMIDAVNAM